MSEIRQKALNAFIWRFSEKIVSHLINLSVTLFLARILMPNDYGLVAFAMIFVSIANVLIISGLNTSLIQKDNIDEIDTSTLFYVTLIFSIVIYLAIYFFSPLISYLYGNDEIINILRLLGLIIPISSYNSILQAKVTRDLAFKKFFIATTSSAVVSGIIGLSMAAIGFGVWALVSQQISLVFLSTICLSLIVKWKPKFVFSLERYKQMRRFGFNMMMANLVGSLFSQLRNFLVGIKYTPSDLAFFTTADMFPAVISSNIDTAVNNVLFPALSKLQDNLENVKFGLRRSMMVSSYVVLPILLIISASADNLVIVLLTEKWMDCVPYIRVLAIGYCFGTLGNANLQALNGIGRSDITFHLELIKKPILLVILILSMQISPLAIAAGTSIYSVIALLINLYPNKKLINYGILEQLKDVFPQFCLATFVALFVFLVGFININIYLLLFLQLSIGFLSYLLLSHIFNMESYLYIKVILKEKGIISINKKQQ